jgi:hypothetical protein
LVVSRSNAALIHGGGYSHSGKQNQQSTPCVYFVHESLEVPSSDILAKTIKNAFEDNDAYHTTHNNGKANIRTKTTERAPWNISNSYGVYFSFGGNSFSKWLQSLQAPLPTKQGSPRGDTATGSMFSRDYSPWSDPRLIYGPRSGTLRRFLHKLINFECAVWRTIARERNERGGHHCVYCAEVLDEDDAGEMGMKICSPCQYEIDQVEIGVGPFLERGLKTSQTDKDFEKGAHEIGSTFEYNIATPPRSPFHFGKYRSRQSDGKSLDDDSDSGLSSQASAPPSLMASPKPARAPESLTPPDSKKRKLNTDDGGPGLMDQIEGENINDAED